MIAHAQRVLTGQGQYIDVSCQEALVRALANAPQSYALEKSVIKRQGSYRQTGRADEADRIAGRKPGGLLHSRRVRHGGAQGGRQRCRCEVLEKAAAGGSHDTKAKRATGTGPSKISGGSGKSGLTLPRRSPGEVGRTSA